MKNPMRNILFSALVLGLSGNAMAVTITVTTTADQNGTDPASCSLREAVRAINTSVAFGGCPAGLSAADNKIQLASGTYTLTDELVLTQEITILGASTYRWDGDTFDTPDGYTDPLTGARVTRITPRTTIKAAAGKRILNAATNSGGMELSDLILDGATLATGNGGVILSSGSVSLDNVQVLNGSAQKGGAIYLAGSAGLSLADATLSGNTASVTGGAVAMDCMFNGSSVVRSVSIQRSLFQSNASAAGAGAIALCGNVTAGVVASTFGANASAAASGALTFADANAADASLSLDYVTAAQHSNGYFLRADGLSSLELSNSVLAANTLNCQVNGVAACTSDDAANRVVITGDMAQLEAFGDFGGLTQGYLPKGALLVDQGEAISSGCAGNDQRNLTRNMGANCDIGAFERLKLTAISDKGSNVSGDDRVAYVDVLANDTYSEDGTGVGGIFRPEDFELLTAGSAAACQIEPADPLNDKPKRIKVDNGGVITPASSPVKCNYQLKDATGILTGAAAVVDVLINNIKPVAEDDAYLRPVGVTSIALDLLANDNDDGDGSYGTANADLVIMIKGSRPKALDGTALPNRVKTSIGVVSGVEVECDDVSGTVSSDADNGSVCFEAGTLTYSADNNLHPFTEEFSYTVFDSDGGQSDPATVTITTDAPAPGSSGGSFDWLLLGLLSLAGLRRTRSF